MKRLSSYWPGVVGCLLGMGIAASWPARAQHEQTARPVLPHEQVRELEVEVDHLHALWNHELFQDVSKKHWAYSALTALQAQGVLKEYPAGYFRGRRPLTRYEFAVAIQRMQTAAPIADSRDKAVVDELAEEFHSALTLIQENAKLSRVRRWLGP